jgi:hypothetical protein
MHFQMLACLRGKGEGEAMSKDWHRGKGEGFSGAALIGTCLASVGLVLAGGVCVLIGGLGFCFGIRLFSGINQNVHTQGLKAISLKQGYLEEEEGSG